MHMHTNMQMQIARVELEGDRQPLLKAKLKLIKLLHSATNTNFYNVRYKKFTLSLTFVFTQTNPVKSKQIIFIVKFQESLVT